MSEFIEKKIDTYAEFLDAIVQSKIYLDADNNYVNQLIEEFDDSSINTAWSVLAGGTGTVTEADDMISVLAPNNADQAQVNSDWLPATYDILIRYIVNAASDATTLRLFSNDINFDRIWVASDSTNIYVKYLHTDGVTWYYWDGAVWTTSVNSCASSIDGYLRVTKTTTGYTIKIYDSTYALQTTATISIASIYDSNSLDVCLFGTGNSNTGTFDADFLFVAGVINDKKTTGRLTNLIDLGQVPLNPGKYSDSIDYANLNDETDPIYNADSAFGLRETAGLEKISQGFKINKDAVIKSIYLYGSKAGTIATGKLVWLEIWTDAGSGKPLALVESYISLKYDANTIFSEANIATFVFNTPKLLFKDVQYHFVLAGDFATSAVNFLDFNFDSAGGYADGKVRHWNGASWVNTTIADTYDIIFGLKLKSSSLISRRIAYSNWQAWVRLTTKADFEGNNQSKNQIDTATKSGFILLEDTGGGVYQLTGYNQNDIDLGRVPTEYSTLSSVYKTPESTTVTFEVAYSDDNITYSALTPVSLTDGSADLSSFGLHRYWRVKVTLTTTDTARTPEVDSWTIDAFKTPEELTERTRLKVYRYLKIEITINSESFTESAVIYYLQAQYKIAYELYIKSVKYTVSEGGIVADLGLSSI